jgi:hypothetical protein
MSANKCTEVNLDELTRAVNEMCESLYHLVSLGESVVSLLAEPPATAQVDGANATAHAPDVRSARRSIRSENASQLQTNDIAREQLISFVQASEMIPIHPSRSTVSRWCSVGCRGLKLESTYIGGRRKTSREAVERFLIACSERHFAGIDGDVSQLREIVLELKAANAAKASKRNRPAKK